MSADFTRLVMITHEFPPFTGGMATYAADLAAAVSATGIEVTVVAPTYERETSETRFEVIPILRHQRLGPRSAAELLARLLATPNDAFWHAVDIRSNLILHIAHLLTGRPYGVTIHGSEASKLGGKGLRVKSARSGYRRAAVVFANSRATARVASAQISHRKLRITHLGVRGEWFSAPPAGCTDSRLDHFLSAGPCICTVGRLEPRKGHQYVLAALRALKETGLEIGYVIAGPVIDADYRRSLERFVWKTGLRVLFAESTSNEDLRRLYSNSVCHVLCARTLPGKTEGFGLVLLEGAAQACPSIVTRVGGMPEVVRHEETGLIVEEGDVDGLTAGLRHLFANRPVRDEMGRRAHEHAKTFTWDACARATYRAILKGY